MAVNKIVAFDVNGKVFTDEKAAIVYDTKLEIVKTLEDLNSVDIVSVNTLNIYQLEELRRIGRMADKILNL